MVFGKASKERIKELKQETKRRKQELAELRGGFVQDVKEQIKQRRKENKEVTEIRRKAALEERKKQARRIGVRKEQIRADIELQKMKRTGGMGKGFGRSVLALKGGLETTFGGMGQPVLFGGQQIVQKPKVKKKSKKKKGKKQKGKKKKQRRTDPRQPRMHLQEMDFTKGFREAMGGF